jgi:Protein of unknown function (DUF2934)
MRISMTPATANRDQQITAMAHKIWEEEGRPDGRAEAHWARAVELVDAPAPAKAGTKAPAKAKKK